MKVKELVEKLLLEDQEAVILLSSDPEGNQFREIPDNCLSGPTVYENDGGDISTFDLSSSAEDNCMTEEEWEEAKADFIPCIILYP